MDPINCGRIRAALRKVWLYSEPRQECVKAARKSRGLYQCNECKKLFKVKEVQCDHIMDIGKFIDWNTFVERLFCPASNLQMLCKGCHQIKTNIATKPVVVGELSPIELELLALRKELNALKPIPLPPAPINTFDLPEDTLDLMYIKFAKIVIESWEKPAHLNSRINNITKTMNNQLVIALVTRILQKIDPTNA